MRIFPSVRWIFCSAGSASTIEVEDRPRFVLSLTPEDGTSYSFLAVVDCTRYCMTCAGFGTQGMLDTPHVEDFEGTSPT
ncbi:hypothetical protein B0H13DRAFT_2652266 [Mycena leptocephala]|nr:hypothetical protein B0H13DRAFT_2652266 [Mycena leptocephala]